MQSAEVAFATAAGVALAVAMCSTPLLVRVLSRRQVVDVPNERSSHTAVVPRGGGIAVILATLLGALAGAVLLGSGSVGLFVFVGAGIFFGVLGFVDDVVGLTVRTRLCLQCVGGLLSAAVLSMSFSKVTCEAVVVLVICMIWMLAFVNAFNFMDGVNGISGVSSVLASTWFGCWAALGDDPRAATGAFALACASAGFLPWNLLRARVFLGDVGSYGVGAMLAVLALLTWGRTGSALLATAPLLVYMADTAFTLVARALRGERVWEAHREHVYQRLTDVGFSHLGSTVTVGAWTVLSCLLVAWQAQPWSWIALTGWLMMYLMLPTLLGRRAQAAA